MELGNGPVIIGHSWVTRLKATGFLPSKFSFIGQSGGTFASLANLIEPIPTHQENDYVFVILGGNDIANAWDLGEVNEIEKMCEDFVLMLRARFPFAKIILSQIEDRFDTETGEINVEHKRKGNKFNKWLNKFDAKDALFTLKGQNFFGLPYLYDKDGVHMNQSGNLKLANRIWNYYDNKLAG